MPDSYVNTTGSHQQPDGRWTHTFSQSMLSTFQKCPEQCRAVYMREVKSEPTDSTSLGTACHAAIEFALYEQRDSERLATIGEMIDVGVHELETIGEWKYTRLSEKKMYQLLPTMLESWHSDIYGSFEPLHIEWKFRELLYSGEHRDIWLNGTADCVETSFRVTDWKTASRPYERWEKQRAAVQPTVYAWAFDQWERKDYDPTAAPLSRPIPFRYGVMLHDGSTQLLDITRNESHVAWLRQQCSQVAWMIERDLNPWPMLDDGWFCSPRWCGVFAAGRCKGAHGIGDTEVWAAT